MSTFDSLESSRQNSQPVELYRFTLGNTVIGFTAGQVDIEVDGVDYVSTGITRSRIIRGQSTRRRPIQISVPQSNVFANLYVGVPPGIRAQVAIFRYQRDAPLDMKRIFTGSVQSVEFPGNGFANIACLASEGVVSRNVLRVSHMGICNHILYGAGCDVDPSGTGSDGKNHTLTNALITAIDGPTITVAGASAAGVVFTAGFVRPTGVFEDQRVILRQTGDDLRLMLPFKNLTVGSRVDVLRGCNHVIDEDCAQVFDNVIQNLSFPFVPNQNPWRKGLTQVQSV